MTKPMILLLLVIAAVPALAQENAVYCYENYCQYLEDDNFYAASPSPWSYSSGSGWASVSDPCAWGGGYTGAAALEPGDSVWQSHATDEFGSWAVQFDLYKASTSVSSNDRITVFVSTSTGPSESHTIYASDYSGLCASNIYVPLNHDYSNYNSVKVTFRRYSASTVDLYIDNATLWGEPF